MNKLATNLAAAGHVVLFESWIEIPRFESVPESPQHLHIQDLTRPNSADIYLMLILEMLYCGRHRSICDDNPSNAVHNYLGFEYLPVECWVLVRQNTSRFVHYSRIRLYLLAKLQWGPSYFPLDSWKSNFARSSSIWLPLGYTAFFIVENHSCHCRGVCHQLWHRIQRPCDL